MKNIKIALFFFRLHVDICPATSLRDVFTQIALPAGAHSGRVHSSSQAAARRPGGENKHQGLFEAGTDHSGTAAEISLVKLRGSNLTQTACSI